MPARPKTPHLFVVEDRGFVTPCHVWTRSINQDGYGARKVDGRVWLAHRYAYTVAVGEIPAGHQVDHLCFVRACVNPEHLEAVTPAENTRRGSGSRLTGDDVLAIRTARSAGVSTVELALAYGVTPSWISRIVSGRSTDSRGRVEVWAAA